MEWVLLIVVVMEWMKAHPACPAVGLVVMVACVGWMVWELERAPELPWHD